MGTMGSNANGGRRAAEGGDRDWGSRHRRGRQNHGMLRGMDRLIEGLQRGEAQAVYVLVFVVVCTVLTVAATEIVQRRRRARDARNAPYHPSRDPARLRLR